MKRILLLLSLLSLALVAPLSAQEQYAVTYSAGEGGRVAGYYYDDASNKVTFESGDLVP